MTRSPCAKQRPSGAEELRRRPRSPAAQTPRARGAGGGAPAVVPAPQRGAERPQPGPQGHLAGPARAGGAVVA